MKELSGNLSLSLPCKIKTAFGKAGDVSVISHSAAGPDGIPRSSGLTSCTPLARDFHLRSEQSLVELGRCLCGRGIPSCCRDHKQLGNSLPLPALVSSSKGWMCQQRHLLIWKNRMTKKILSVSLVLMDFNAVWHMRGREEEEELTPSLSNVPSAHL